jgi:hypothetical protein
MPAPSCANDSTCRVQHVEADAVRRNTNTLQVVVALLFFSYWIMLATAHLLLWYYRGYQVTDLRVLATLAGFIAWPFVALWIESIVIFVVSIVYGLLARTTRLPTLDTVFLNTSSIYSVNYGESPGKTQAPEIVPT